VKTRKKRFSQENKELRRENSRLKKKVSQLEGSIDSLTDSFGVHDDFSEPEETEDAPRTEAFGSCPKCGEQAGEVDFGKFTYLICQSCKHRERIGHIKNK
jgi:cell division septum initiation protein DivIVA